MQTIIVGNIMLPAVWTAELPLHRSHILKKGGLSVALSSAGHNRSSTVLGG